MDNEQLILKVRHELDEAIYELNVWTHREKVDNNLLIGFSKSRVHRLTMLLEMLLEMLNEFDYTDVNREINKVAEIEIENEIENEMQLLETEIYSKLESRWQTEQFARYGNVV